MITPEHARTLFAYDAWANRRLLDACGTLTAEQFTKDLGSSFRSVRDTMAHIMGAEALWLERFQGRTASLASGDQFSDLASLRARWEQVERELTPAGYALVETQAFLPRQHFFVLQKRDR